MSVIRTIRRKLHDGEYEFTVPHFFEELAEDGLEFSDVEAAIGNGRVRRRFTRDLRGTRYEVVGTGTDGRRLAVICRLKETGKLLFITTYVLE